MCLRCSSFDNSTYHSHFFTGMTLLFTKNLGTMYFEQSNQILVINNLINYYFANCDFFKKVKCYTHYTLLHHNNVSTNQAEAQLHLLVLLYEQNKIIKHDWVKGFFFFLPTFEEISIVSLLGSKYTTCQTQFQI